MGKISTCNHQSHFHMIKTISSPASRQVLRAHECPQRLARIVLSVFFDQKVVRLRTELGKSIYQDMSVKVTENCKVSMSHFEVIHEDELKNIIKSTSNSSCQLDPISTNLLKQSTSVLLPTLTRVVNMSLQSGTVPPSNETFNCLFLS